MVILVFGDEKRTGSFWKKGPKPGIETIVPVPFDISDSGCGIVDIPKTFSTGEYMAYPQAWPIPRSLL